MGTDKPSCVKELYAFEDTWTDYTAQVYCKISPNELKKIIHDLKLEREEKPHYIEEKSLKETMIKEICDQPPIKNLIIYSYQKIKGEQFIYSRTLYTNKAYNRVFITYMAD